MWFGEGIQLETLVHRTGVKEERIVQVEQG